MRLHMQNVIKGAAPTVGNVSTFLSAVDRVEALLGAAQKAQAQAQTDDASHQGVYLCCQALELTQQLAAEPLLLARSLVALGTALRHLPDPSAEVLVEAQLAYNQALPLLQEHADAVTIALVYLQLSCVLRELMPHGLASIHDVVQTHRNAQRVLTGEDHPQEYARLHNNLAIAYLSLPRHHPQRSLAVSTLRLALEDLCPTAHPWEYAMLQKTLGNALQSLPTHHPLASPWCAIAAYDEAIRLHTLIDQPLDYADILVNKANVLAHLAEDPGNSPTLHHGLQARALLLEAQDIFGLHQQRPQVQAIGLSLAELDDWLDWAQTAR